MKAALGILAGLLSAVAALAQGQVVFANTASTQFRVYTNTWDGGHLGPTSVPNGYRFGLYAAQGAGQPSNALTLVGLAVNLSASPALYGLFNGGNPFAMPAPYAAGDTITFQIRAWPLSKGNAYEEAVIGQSVDPLNVALGISGIGTTTLTASPAPPAPLFGTAPGLLSTGFVIMPIPEPSTVALGLLGAAAFALTRRRRH